MKKHSTRHKNSVFCLLFNDPDKLRGLYNALTGLSYGKDTPVSINTLKDELFEGPRNDISFTIGGKTIVLTEHQSTINPNVPAGLLFYIAAIYEKLLPGKSLYGKRIVKIPRPEFFLFYNGLDAFPDETVLRLSHAFEEDRETAEASLELLVKAYNINAGYNKELLGKVRDLDEYARFVDVVRKKQAGQKSKEKREEAFRLAIKECIEHNILKVFLGKYGEEVLSSLNISWEEYVELRIEEAREEGREEAREEANRETARRLKAMGLSTPQIAEGVGLSPEEIENL